MVERNVKLELKWLSWYEMGCANWRDIGKEENLQNFTGKGEMRAWESKVILSPWAGKSGEVPSKELGKWEGTGHWKLAQLKKCLVWGAGRIPSLVWGVVGYLVRNVKQAIRNIDLGHVKDGRTKDTGMSKDDGWQMMPPKKEREETERKGTETEYSEKKKNSIRIRGGKRTVHWKKQWGEAVRRCNLEREERFLGRRDGHLGWSYWRCRGFYCGYQSMSIHELQPYQRAK